MDKNTMEVLMRILRENKFLCYDKDDDGVFFQYLNLYYDESKDLYLMVKDSDVIDFEKKYDLSGVFEL